jgi:hypothetical protein
MIEIMNLRNTKPTLPYDIKIDRSGILGNPFRMNSENFRSTVCNLYQEYAIQQLKDTNSVYYSQMQTLLKLYSVHGKLRLFCWCAPKRCHGEFIREYLYASTRKDSL